MATEEQRERWRVAARAWRAKNPERSREIKHAERTKNRDRYVARSREYYAANRERLLDEARERRRATPEKHRAVNRQYRIDNPERIREQRRLKKYGVSAAAFTAMLAAQGGRCAICGTDTPSGKGDWCLDHDHDFPSGDPRGHRGVLCVRCNTSIGLALNRPDVLRRAAAYIEEHGNRLRRAS